MKDRTSKNRQKGPKSNSTSNSGQSNQNTNQKKQNESAVKPAKQQKNIITHAATTAASPSSKPESKNGTNCDSGECFNVSQNGNVVPTTQIIQNCNVTTPSSDETDRSTTVDSNCNNISVDTTPNRDINSDVVSSNIVKTATSHLDIDNESNIATSTQNAQSNQLPSTIIHSNFRNQIMEEMKSASADVPVEPSASNTSLEKQTSLTYTDGQWSPNNADGKKFYNRDQLISLRNQPASMFVPSFSGQLAAIAKSNQSSVPMGSHNNLLPKFVAQNSNFRQATSSQRNQYSKRPSQNSMQNQSQSNGSNKGSRTGMIHMSLSLHDDVKLNETENAWLPSFLKKEPEPENTESSNEILFKRVRGVLNKLTPERFDTLFDEIKNFNIDTVERLNGVIFLVFEKAIDEPSFSVAYAQLCNKLSQLVVSVSDNEQKSFKKTLITKCQYEFDQHVVNETTIAAKLAPFLVNVKEATDPEKKAEYQAILDEEERKLRRRSVGTVRFIGELYKIGMLTVRIMMACVKILISDKDSEDKLECMCKLLTTVGARLEESIGENKGELNEHFRQMQLIVDKKIPNLKISSRVRFMLQDVIDLRKSKWVPRRNDVNPKTMGQIQKEADDEQHNNNLLNFMVSSRRDDRGGRNENRMHGGYQKSNRGNQPGEDGWSMNSKSRSQTYFDSSKFKSKSSIDDNTPLGVASQFKWNQGTGTTSTAPPIGNKFAVLDSVRGDSINVNRNRRSGRDNIHSKGSMDRYQYERRGSRSGSQQGSRENSLVRGFPQRNTPPFSRSSHSMHALPVTAQSSASNEKITEMSNSPMLNVVEPSSNDVIKVQKFVRNLLENHHIGEVSLPNCHVDVENIPLQQRWVMVREIFNSAVEVQRLKTADRIFAGKAVSQWIKMKYVTINDLLNGVKCFLEPVEDISVDIPHIWLYIAECFGPIIENEHLKLINLKSLCPDHVHRILEDLLPHLKSTYGSTFVKSLLLSNELSSLIPRTELITAKLKNIVTSLTNEDDAHKTKPQEYVQGKSVNNVMDGIQRHIKNLLTKNTKLDDIYNYISVNVTKIDDNFIRALTTAVTDSSLDNKLKLNEAIFKDRIPLIERYLDGNEHFELQCLIAVQILVNKLEHPQGLMQNIFSLLITERIVSAVSIMNWKNRNDVMEGKGVAVAYLRSFFDMLEKMDETGDISSEDEDN